MADELVTPSQYSSSCFQQHKGGLVLDGYLTCLQLHMALFYWIEELEFECSVGIASRVDDRFSVDGFFSLCYECTFLKHKDQKALYSALERLKEELMLLGFISFVLSLSEGFIVGICVSENAMHLMLPCKKESYQLSEGVKLCKKKGEVPLLSVEALHQLHIFIFILGLVHVVFCATTILLGGAKIRKWKLWETEIQQEMQQKLQQRDATPGRIAHNQQGEFVSERTKGLWMKLAVVSWIIAFFKQFHDSVSKSDYKALRSAFGLDSESGISSLMEQELFRDWFFHLGLGIVHCALPLQLQAFNDYDFAESQLIKESLDSVLIQVICSYVTLPLYAIVTHMDGGIKLQGIGSGLHESVAGWALDARRKKEEQQSSHGGATTGATEGSNYRSDHFGASPRSALAPPPPPSPDLVEIVSVAAADDDGDDSRHRR
uniref:MLO-like protein n=1 Tax=Oryza glaberrima TaxID=4538 RepID=I1Q3L0_ORYGL